MGIVRKTEAQPLIEALLAEINGNLSTDNFRRGSLDASKLFDIGSLRLAGIRDVVPVATLPTVKKDGEIVYFQTSAMATTGTLWTLKWSATNNRWDFIGGPPIIGGPLGGNTQAPPGTSTFFALLGGPSVTVPKTGKYFIRHGAQMSYMTGGPGREYFNVGLHDGTAMTGFYGSGWTDIAGTANGDAETSVIVVDEIIFATTPTLTQRYRAQSNSTTVVARLRWIELIPRYLDP